MESAWEILGLNSETASEKDAKRSYARLLKQHRPDRDPEGFQRIREAYDEVKSMLNYRSWMNVQTSNEGDQILIIDPHPDSIENESDEVDIDGVSPLAARSFDAGFSQFPSELKSLREQILEIQTLNENWELSELDQLREIYLQGQDFCKENPGYIGIWGEFVAESFEAHPGKISEWLRLDDLVRELENDYRFQTNLKITHLLDIKDYDQLGRIAKFLIENKKKLVNPVAAAVFSDLASELGFISRKTATELIDLAYPNLPPQIRNHAVGRAEYWIQTGSIFAPAMNEQRMMFWNERLREGPHSDFDWWGEIAREEVSELCNSWAVPAGVMAHLEDILPEEILNRVKVASPPRSSQAGSYRPAQPDPPTLSGPTIVRILIGVVLMIIGMVNIFKCSGSKPIPTIDPKLPNFTSLESILKDADLGVNPTIDTGPIPNDSASFLPGISPLVAPDSGNQLPQPHPAIRDPDPARGYRRRAQ